MPAPDERHHRFLAKRLLQGRVVPFLGAGVNLAGRPDGQPSGPESGGLPNGRELAGYLAADHPEATEDGVDLLKVAQYVDAMYGEGVLYEELRALLDGEYDPTVVHALLADVCGLLAERAAAEPERGRRVKFPVIVTTNYDDLMEQALERAGLDYDLVWYEAKRRDEAFGALPAPLLARPDLHGDRATERVDRGGPGDPPDHPQGPRRPRPRRPLARQLRHHRGRLRRLPAPRRRRHPDPERAAGVRAGWRSIGEERRPRGGGEETS